ncbi:MAG: hypothetical protein Q7W54_08805, partial [Bacteroidota bacterium]|nr:hypothetical protein [Bacteroidota bacterium]
MYQARIKVALFYIVSALFILLNAYFLVQKHSMIINAMPLVLGIILLAIYAFDKLLYLIVFFTPLSTLPFVFLALITAAVYAIG